jgi:hypothetical protein
VCLCVCVCVRERERERERERKREKESERERVCVCAGMVAPCVRSVGGMQPRYSSRTSGVQEKYVGDTRSARPVRDGDSHPLLLLRFTDAGSRRAANASRYCIKVATSTAGIRTCRRTKVSVKTKLLQTQARIVPGRRTLDWSGRGGGLFFQQQCIRLSNAFPPCLG